MELHIKNESTIKDVQMQFNTLYPFLQLQFLKSMQNTNKDVRKMAKVIPEIPIKNLRTIHTPAVLSVENNVTVAQLLESLREMGLLAQVCRKSANQWVETSLTDDWTLEHQNKEAMMISVPMENFKELKREIP